MRKLLAFCMVIAVFAAVTGSVFAYTPEPFDGFPYDDQPNAVIEKDVIVVMGSSNFDPSRSAGSYLQEVTRLFEQLHPNIDVQLNYGSWGDLWKKVGVMLGNRQGPDLVVGPREYLMASGRGAGQWEDILTVPEELFLDEVSRKAVGPAVLESSRFPGRPGYMVWPWTLYVDGTMVINGDMVREAGLDPLEIQKNGWTMEQFREIAKKVTKDTDGDGKVDQWAAYFGPVTGGHNGERIGHTGLYTHNIPLRLRAHDIGTATFIDIKTGELFLDEEGFLKGWKFLRQMIDEDGTIPKNSIGVSMDESREAFINGKTAFSFDGPDLLGLVDERNRLIANGQEKGTPVDAYVVPRPYFSGKDWVQFPIRVLSYGYYSFKQEPYKGDAHTRNVFKFARFLSNPVFQVRNAYSKSIPPDMRVYYGENSWFPGILGTGANAKYMESLPQVWQPRMGIYIQMATTEKWQKAVAKFDKEVVQPAREAVFLGKLTPEEAIAKIRAGLEQLGKEVPKEERLTADAPQIAKDFDAYAKQTGQKF